MTEAAKRGGPRKGAGPKPKSPSGQPMKTRPTRWDDADWQNVKLVGMDRVRELVRKEAAKVRKQQGNE